MPQPPPNRWILLLAGSVLVVALACGASQIARGYAVLRLKKMQGGEKEVVDSTKDPLTVLRDFKKKAETLEPEQAAREWMQAVAVSLGLRGKKTEGTPTFEQWVEVLPGPATWPALVKEADALTPEHEDARQNLFFLRSFVLLVNDHPAEAIRALDPLFTERLIIPPQKRESLIVRTFSAQMAIAERCLPPQQILALFRQQLQVMETRRFITDIDGATAWFIPDLVTLAGENEAKALLRRVFISSPAPIKILTGWDTETLAQTICREQMAKLRSPQPFLLESFDSVELWEAMRGRFAPLRIWWGVDPNTVAMAKKWRILTLITERKDLTAFHELETYNEESESSFYLTDNMAVVLDAGAWRTSMFEFMEKALGRVDLWEDYLYWGEQWGFDTQILEKIDRVLERQKITPTFRGYLKHERQKILLRRGQVEEVGNELSEHLQTPGSRNNFRAIKSAAELAWLGQTSGHEEWRKQGRDFLEENSSQIGNQGADVWAHILESDAPGKDGERTEWLLRRALYQAEQNARRNLEKNQNNHLDTQKELLRLVNFQLQHGQASQALRLFNRAEGWGTRDLGFILDQEEWPTRTPELGILATRVFSATGKEFEARATMEALMDTNTHTMEWAPEYIRLVGVEKALARFQAVAVEYPDNPYPLLWQARALEKMGKWGEAYSAARTVVQRRPYDAPFFDSARMKALLLQAEIGSTLGYEAEVEGIQTRLKAIPLVEKAEKLESFDLETEALQAYREAEKFYPDSCYLQIKLAQLQARRLEMDNAEKAYRAAFALLPAHLTSQDESLIDTLHLLDKSMAREIGLEVVGQHLKEHPDDAAAHYLMGRILIQDDSDKFSEAMEHFQKVCQLDPSFHLARMKVLEYSGAKYQDLTQRRKLSQELLDVPAILSVSQVHAFPETLSVWRVVKSWADTDAPREVYPLRGSARRVSLLERLGHQEQEEEFSPGRYLTSLPGLDELIRLTDSTEESSERSQE